MVEVGRPDNRPDTIDNRDSGMQYFVADVVDLDSRLQRPPITWAPDRNDMSDRSRRAVKAAP